MNATSQVTNFQTLSTTLNHCVQSGHITQSNGDDYLIDANLLAIKSDGVGLELNVGDYVAYLVTKEHIFIVALLVAVPRKTAKFGFQFADQLSISAKALELFGRDSVSLHSMKDVSLMACRRIKLNCTDYFQTVVGSAVNVMRNWIHQCDQGSLQAKDVLRTDAGNQIITASKDLRLDAERINMG